MPDHFPPVSSDALEIVLSSIKNCERQQPKFVPGTPQFSLLQNRIKALKIAESLLKNDGSIKSYGKAELEKALLPIISIRSKTTNARLKHPEGSVWYRRLTPIIETMQLCQKLLESELFSRSLK